MRSEISTMTAGKAVEVGTCWMSAGLDESSVAGGTMG